jgi:hypothetical protein
VAGDELAEFGYGHLFEPVDARQDVAVGPHLGKWAVGVAALVGAVEQKINATEFQGDGFVVGVHGAIFQDMLIRMPAP